MKLIVFFLTFCGMVRDQKSLRKSLKIQSKLGGLKLTYIFLKVNSWHLSWLVRAIKIQQVEDYCHTCQTHKVHFALSFLFIKQPPASQDHILWFLE